MSLRSQISTAVIAASRRLKLSEPALVLTAIALVFHI
jgi:hypothetical protein